MTSQVSFKKKPDVRFSRKTLEDKYSKLYVMIKFISPELCKNMYLKHCNPNIGKRGTSVIMSTTEMKLKCNVLI